MAAEIPVWVNSRLRWVTGIGRKTTCDDVIAVLLRGEEDGRTRCEDTATRPLQEVQGFAIMERWRRMERPLGGRSRILRVWNAWGDAQDEVRFTLKRVTDWEADSGRGSPGRDSNSTLARRRKHHHRGTKLPWPPLHQTIHPRRLAQLHQHHNRKNFSNKLPETIERLMKLILAQGETIQNQLRRLHDRDNQIEHMESETHRTRVETLGSNYLLETYLRLDPENVEGEDEEEKADDSGVVTEGGSDQLPATPPEAPSATVNSAGSEPAVDHDDAILPNLKARVELWEKLAKVNKRLQREEECLVRLHVKIRRYTSGQEDALRLLPDQGMDEESFRIRDALLRDLERVRLELEQGTRELEHNTLALAETETLLDARRHYLKRLQAELEASDLEEMVAQHTAVATCASANDTDSNSDTGLSSLHSGSEEGVYVLDTLV
jgi:Ras association domain-containing protein 9/10